MAIREVLPSSCAPRPASNQDWLLQKRTCTIRFQLVMNEQCPKAQTLSAPVQPEDNAGPDAAFGCGVRLVGLQDPTGAEERRKRYTRFLYWEALLRSSQRPAA